MFPEAHLQALAHKNNHARHPSQYADDPSLITAEQSFNWADFGLSFHRHGLKAPWFKGKFGETIVARSLKTRLNSEVYKVLNDVMIPDQAGGTTQIDHVVFSPLMIVDGATPCYQGCLRWQFVLGLLQLS